MDRLELRPVGLEPGLHHGGRVRVAELLRWLANQHLGHPPGQLRLELCGLLAVDPVALALKRTVGHELVDERLRHRRAAVRAQQIP